MSLAEPASNSTSVIDQAAAVATTRERMWPAQGMVRHLAVVAAIFVVTIIANVNTLTQRYVIMDRSGFTLDSRYIIELDPRSRVLQWDDRIELQQDIFLQAAKAIQEQALFQHPHDFSALAARAKDLADPVKYSDYGFSNYFTKDYWWPKGISGLYRPLTSITYWWNFAAIRAILPPAEWDKMREEKPEEYYRVHAKALVSFHWTNTILHAVCASLVYFLMLAICHRFWVSAFAAALFATHPITVESVANIIGRADILAAISTFLTLLLYIRSTKVSGVARLPWLFLAMIVTTIGVFAKESALAVGPAVAAYEIVFRYRPRIGPIFVELRNWFDDLTRLLGDFLAACIRFAFRGWIWLIPPVIAVFYVRHLVFAASTPPEEPFLDNPIRGNPYTGLNENPVLNLIEGRVTALKVLVLLFNKMLFPVHLSSDYSFNEIKIFNSSLTSLADYGALLCALIVLGFVVWATVLWIRGSRAAAYMIFFYLLAALPTSNLIKVIGSIMAERFMYLPLFGFVGGLSLAVFWIGEKIAARAVPNRSLSPTEARTPAFRPISLVPHVVLSLVVVVYTGRTLNRNLAWRSDELLWESALDVSKNAFRCYQSYAFALYENAQIDKVRGRIDDEEYKRRVQKMIDIDEQGLKIVDVLPVEMNSARLYLHLGMYYAEMGRIHLKPNSNDPMTPEARPWYEKSVAMLKRAEPIDKAFSKLNRRKEIARLKPMNEIPEAGLAPVYLILGESQTRLGQLEDAIASYRYVQQLDPMSAVSYVQIGAIRLNQSKIDDAVTSLLQAIILDPSRPEPWPMLKNVYQALGEPNAIVTAGGQNQVNASSPLVQQHVRNAMRDLVRIMVNAKQFDFARTLRRQAIDVHRLPPALLDSFFIDAGVPVEPAPPEQTRWR